MKAILFIALLFTAANAEAKEKGREPKSDQGFCGLVVKVGYSGGQHFAKLSHGKVQGRSSSMLQFKLGDESDLTIALNAAQTSLNSMGKISFCVETATAKISGDQVMINSDTAYFVSTYNESF